MSIFFSEFIQPARLPAYSQDLLTFADEWATATGWGVGFGESRYLYAISSINLAVFIRSTWKLQFIFEYLHIIFLHELQTKKSD